jgi:hypothetical protein
MLFCISYHFRYEKIISGKIDVDIMHRMRKVFCVISVFKLVEKCYAKKRPFLWQREGIEIRGDVTVSETGRQVRRALSAGEWSECRNSGLFKSIPSSPAREVGAKTNEFVCR